MTPICKRFFISGKVQGVFYRDNTCKKARELNITGWVRNRGDGRVELMACGLPENVAALETWLWQGSPASDVTDVSGEETPWEIYNHFVILSDDAL